ncbi:MAG: hypothetical protein AAFN30_06135, partial [Actinomycetota bacterium]
MAALLFGLPMVGWTLLIVVAWLFARRITFDNRTDEFSGFSAGLLVASVVILVVTMILMGIGWLA